MSDIKIRRVERRDTERVVKLAVEAWTPIYEGYRTELGDDIYAVAYPGAPIEEKAKRIMNAAGTGNMLVAETDGEICGFAT